MGQPTDFVQRRTGEIDGVGVIVGLEVDQRAPDVNAGSNGKPGNADCVELRMHQLALLAADSADEGRGSVECWERTQEVDVVTKVGQQASEHPDMGERLVGSGRVAGSASAEVPARGSDRIAVLGATGAVGIQLAQILAQRGHSVVCVSRHQRQVDELAGLLPNATGVAGDLGSPSLLDRLGEPGVVVNCTGKEDLRSIQCWREARWSVIDVTASSRYAAELASLACQGPPLVVGVGLTPGLTSLLARELVHAHPETRAVTISCLVGLGDEYGNASRDWTYGQLGQSIDDPAGKFRNFSDPETIEFPGGFGRRPAWRFDFADRLLLPPESGVAVTTRYCFDSRLAGRSLAIASAIPGAPQLLHRISHPSKSAVDGTTWWAGVVETDKGARATALGNSQSRGTAAVTALAAERLAQMPDDCGARFLWDLVDLRECRQHLATTGIAIDIDTTRATSRTGRSS